MGENSRQAFFIALGSSLILLRATGYSPAFCRITTIVIAHTKAFSVVSVEGENRSPSLAWLEDGVLRLLSRHDISVRYKEDALSHYEAAAYDGGLPILVGDLLRLLAALGNEGILEGISVEETDNSLLGYKLVITKEEKARESVAVATLMITSNIRHLLSLSPDKSVDLHQCQNSAYNLQDLLANNRRARVITNKADEQEAPQ
ncbi:hypothetical protein [Thiolapillus sp.]|uniref:hypothetical protein n=1 Tax=Thiolapillus sp. TaxID=2017437 RepID=UPI0025CCCD25|nr:hypothetical protein [Thiolapillus sp.]